MFRKLCICAAGLLVTANVALASPASQVGDRKDPAEPRFLAEQFENAGVEAGDGHADDELRGG